MCRSLSLTALVIILLSFLQAASLQSCEVLVTTPWESITYIPRDSSVVMSCTGEKNQVPAWTITLPGHLSVLRFAFQQQILELNKRNFYKMLDDEHDVNNSIQLLINSTEGKNGTTIQCDDIGSATKLYETNLTIYEPTATNLSLDADVIGLQLVNISWNPLHLNQFYALRVDSENTQPQLHESLESSFLFSAPEGVPPCEVYNFSVTATYIGATYTGAGCNVSSPVLSIMLPSLPNKQQLESSLNYSVERKGANALSITVSIDDTSHYCEGYPVINYTMVLENFFNSSETLSLFMAPNERYFSTSYLSENTIYVFRMLASNAFGSISTDKEIYTTDVQLVSAVELRDLSAYRVRCDFMTGSIAKGCMVILVGELGNITMNFMRGTDIEVMNTTNPTSCYNRVVAYDIESDGSVGSLALPGKILADTTSSSVAPCLQRQATPFPGPQTVKIVLVVVSVIFFVMICTIGCIIIKLLCKLKKRSRFKTTVKSNSPDKVPPVSVVAPHDLSHYSQEPAIPLYELPNNLPQDEKNADTCKSASEDPSHNVLMHYCEESVPNNEDRDCPGYAMLQEEHVYHVLENGKIQQKPGVVDSTCNDNYDTPEFTSDKPPAEEFPIYQEVSELSVKNPLAVS